jgi:hypothetical protein
MLSKIKKEERKRESSGVQSFATTPESIKQNSEHLNKAYHKTIGADLQKFTYEINEIEQEEEGLENDFKTKCLYHKLQFEDGMTAFYTFASIITSCISYEGKTTNIDHENYQIFTLMITTIFNILACKFF